MSSPADASRTRLRRLSVALTLLGAALALVGVDAAARRARDQDDARRRAVVHVLGTADLALSSNARWMRHPTQAEPGAPFDLPGGVDTEPAGAAVGPPVELYHGVPATRRGAP